MQKTTGKLTKFCSLAIPNKMMTIHPAAHPWLNSHVRRAIRKRKRAHKFAKRLNNEESWRKYRVLRNESIKSLRTAKHDFTSNLASKLTTRNMSSKDWWKNFKICVGKDSRENIPPLKNDYGQTINKPKEKAGLFNKYFHSQTLLDDRDKDVPVLSVPNNTIDSIRLEVEEVQIILKSLQVGKVSGPDFINSRILKEIAVSISTALTELFDTSLLLAQVSDIWKRANVSPIYKKDDKTDVVNYRRISLIISVGKALKKLVQKHVHNFVLENNIITSFQSGFTRGDSTVNQLVDLYNTFCHALEGSSCGILRY